MSEPFEMLTLHTSRCAICREPLGDQGTYGGHVLATLSLEPALPQVSLLLGWHSDCGDPWDAIPDRKSRDGYFGEWQDWMGAEASR